MAQQAWPPEHFDPPPPFRKRMRMLAREYRRVLRNLWATTCSHVTGRGYWLKPRPGVQVTRFLSDGTTVTTRKGEPT